MFGTEQQKEDGWAREEIKKNLIENPWIGENGTLKKRSYNWSTSYNKDLYRYVERISDTLRERTPRSYGRLTRMNESGSAKKIFN